MITNGESEIEKICCVMSNDKVGTPCGACRELIMQLDKNSKNIEILLNKDNYKTITMNNLMPDWWGTTRLKSKVKKKRKTYTKREK